jgi:hypothetical protein
MHLNRTIPALLACAAILFAGAAQAGVREDQLAQYASAAKAETPGFAGFSAERGKTLHTQNFTGGKPDTPACTSCHGKDPRGTGRAPTHRAPFGRRYADPAKVGMVQAHPEVLAASAPQEKKLAFIWASRR